MIEEMYAELNKQKSDEQEEGGESRSHGNLGGQRLFHVG